MKHSQREVKTMTKFRYKGEGGERIVLRSGMFRLDKGTVIELTNEADIAEIKTRPDSFEEEKKGKKDGGE
jgi:hypothetical protein